MHMLNALRTTISFVTMLVSAIIYTADAQVLNERRCKAFRDSPQLYVLDRPINTQEVTTSTGEVITFLEVVKKTWPDKEVTYIDELEYEKLPDVRSLFFITLDGQTRLESLERSVGNAGMTSTRTRLYSFEYMVLQRGVTKLDKDRYVHVVYLDITGIFKGTVPERLEYAVSTMKEQTDLPFTGVRDKHTYRSDDLSSILAQNTLYINENKLSEKYRDGSRLRKEYPYKFKIVPYLELMAIISRKEEGVLYIEEISFIDISAVHVRLASTGRLVYGGYPIYGSKDRTVVGIRKGLSKQ